jgi:hypothetical protein
MTALILVGGARRCPAAHWLAAALIEELGITGSSPACSGVLDRRQQSPRDLSSLRDDRVGRRTSGQG